MDEKIKQVIYAVKVMRFSQKAYFQYRTPEHLRDAKEKETKVDELLNNLDQGTLF